jgi:hypothetical protein
MKVRLSVNAILSGGRWVSMGEPIEESELPPTLRKYIVKPGQGMRRTELGATGTYVPGVAYRMKDGQTIRDEATRVAEEEQSARLLQIDEENWRRSGLRFEGSGPDESAET